MKRPCFIIRFTLLVAAVVAAGIACREITALGNSLPTTGHTQAGLFSGLQWSLADHNKLGFESLQNGFRMGKIDPDLNLIIKIPMVVHIIGHKKFFDYPPAAASGSKYGGYATHGNHIYIFGTRCSGKIIVNQGILGHEVNHLLNFHDPQIADPDKLENIQCP